MPDGIAINVSAAPSEAERAAILEALAAYNASQGYPGDMQLVSIPLTDGTGTTIGGLWGKTVYDWLYVEFLIVPESLRGHDLGTTLMDLAEDLARSRSCVGAWLTTFTYQARPFYEARGYEVFGELPRSPGDNVRIFMRKFLGPTEKDRASAV